MNLQSPQSDSTPWTLTLSRSPKCCYFFFVKGSHPTEIEKTSSGVKTISTDSHQGTGKSFSEALILESVNPQYDKRLFIEFTKNTNLQHVV